jgi:N-carbamoylputrescine amidase
LVAGNEERERMKLGLIQIRGNCRVKPNFQKLVTLVRSASDSGARIIVLPELFLHRYFCQKKDSRSFKMAHNLELSEIIYLQNLAAELEIVIVAPFFEKRKQNLYHNSAAVFNADGSSLGIYRKMHVPDDPGYYEKFYFTPGDLGYKCFPTRYGRIGVLICWDQWFPEAARLAAMQGCDVLVCPTAIAWDIRDFKGLSEKKKRDLKHKELEAWKVVQRGHAIANGIFLAAVNRVGKEGSLDFWGNAFVCDPLGRVLAELNNKEERALVVDCEFEQVDKVRRAWPLFRERL